MLNASVLENGNESPPVVEPPIEQPPTEPVAETRIPYAKKRTSPLKKSVARKSTAQGTNVYRKPADLMLKIKQEKFDPGYERQEMIAMNVSIKQEPMDYDEVNTQAQIPVAPPEPLPVVAAKKKRAPRAAAAKKTVAPSHTQEFANEEEPQYETTADIAEDLPYDAAESATNIGEAAVEEPIKEIVQVCSF